MKIEGPQEWAGAVPPGNAGESRLQTGRFVECLNRLGSQILSPSLHAAKRMPFLHPTRDW